MHSRSILDGVEGLKTPKRLIIERARAKYKHGKYVFGYGSRRKGQTELCVAVITRLLIQIIQDFVGLEVHGPWFEESIDYEG